MAQSVTCLSHKHEDLSSERASTPVPMHKATFDAGEHREGIFQACLQEMCELQVLQTIK